MIKFLKLGIGLTSHDDENYQGCSTRKFSFDTKHLFNIHQGMEQVWMSSPFSGGRHFFYQASSWIDTRSGEELGQVFKTELYTHYQIVLSDV